MLIVNYSWERLFKRIEYNKRAICKRGWFPYNRNILTYYKLRLTMTDVDRKSEYEAGLVPYTTVANTIPNNAIAPTQVNANTIPNNVITPTLATAATTLLNFKNGMAAYFLDALVSEADYTAAVQRNKKNTMKEKH